MTVDREPHSLKMRTHQDASRCVCTKIHVYQDTRVPRYTCTKIHVHQDTCAPRYILSRINPNHQYSTDDALDLLVKSLALSGFSTDGLETLDTKSPASSLSRGSPFTNRLGKTPLAQIRSPLGHDLSVLVFLEVNLLETTSGVISGTMEDGSTLTWGKWKYFFHKWDKGKRV